MRVQAMFVMMPVVVVFFVFFFSSRRRHTRCSRDWSSDVCSSDLAGLGVTPMIEGLAPQGLEPCRSEEHTSELQSRLHLVCRLLLEKKKKRILSFWLFRCKPTPAPSLTHSKIH